MITVVTITYNNFEELVKTLNSVPKSANVESIVVNGGNCPKTFEFLKNYNGIVINEKDNGISDAFNKGIKKSSGEFIMFLNSGDILIDPSYPVNAEKIFRDNREISFIHSNFIFEDNIGGRLLMKPIMKNIGRGMPYFHPTMIVRKSVFSKTGFFDTDYKIAMDYDFAIKLDKHGIKGYYVSDKAPVVMDGTGKSAEQEYTAIMECWRALRKNNYLSVTVILNFGVRIVLYYFRRILVAAGLSSLLGKLKKIKHKIAV